MDYKKLNDYELVYQVRENDEIAYEALCKKYSNLVEIIASKYYKKNKYLGIDFEDLYQEGMYGFVRALNDYDPSSKLFYSYVVLCASREIERIIKACGRKKHTALNSAISLSKEVNIEKDITVEDMIPSKYSLEKDIETNNEYKRLYDFKYELEDIDSAIYELRVNDFTLKEISQLMDIPYKKVENRLHNIRKKLLEFI
ncbi:MAG: sigma-70 family RNA polymerase sigma factor [Bacilli bacterium]|nr:sigma-70 family RNA polymerase sigma factor [Bacilli bacterium]